MIDWKVFLDQKVIKESIKMGKSALIQWRASRASGPGGQHLHKSNTQAHLTITCWPKLLFDDFTQDFHSEKRFSLSIRSQAERSLDRNKNDCMEKAVEKIRQHALDLIPQAEPSAQQQHHVLQLKQKEKRHIRIFKSHLSNKKASRGRATRFTSD